MPIATIHSRWENGNLVHYDSLTGARIETIPCQTRLPNPQLLASVVRMAPNLAMDYVEHFMTFSEDEWTTILTDVGVDGAEVHALTDMHGGVLLLSTNDADEDETGIESDAEICEPDNGLDNDTYFQVRFKVDDADKCEVNLGLTVTDAKPGRHHAAGGGVTDGVYIWSPHNTDVLYGSCTNGGASTDTIIGALGNAVWITAGFHFDDSANSVQFNVNGVDVGLPCTTNTPAADELGIMLAVQTGELVAHSMWVDWYRLISEV